jgi:hypothetical protein
LVRQISVKQAFVRQRLVGQMSAGQALRCPNGASEKRCVALMTVAEKLHHHPVYFLMINCILLLGCQEAGGVYSSNSIALKFEKH